MEAASLPGTSALNGQPAVEGETVVLGDKTYVIVAQRQGYLRKKLPKVFENIETMGEDASQNAGLLDVVSHRAWLFLKVLIPKLMPEWEFNGYPNERAWLNDEYDEDQDYSPTPPQIRNAIEAAIRVNGFDLLKHLGKVVNMDLVKATVNNELASLAETRLGTSSATSTPDTPSTTTGTTDPTPIENEDSPSPESPDSFEQPESVAVES